MTQIRNADKIPLHPPLAKGDWRGICQRGARGDLRNDGRMMARARRQKTTSTIPASIVPRPSPLEAVCIGCCCTDNHACLPLIGDPCHWLKVDYLLGIGVCSECEEKIEEFETRVNKARLEVETA